MPAPARSTGLAALAAVLCASCGRHGEPREVEHPAALVIPTVGSGGFAFAHGAAYPGASAPNGLAKVGPDTSGPYGTISFLHFSGYWYGDDTIQGFSHLHLHGTGATDYGVIGVMPVPAGGEPPQFAESYQSKFAKSSEVATPGYYAATLDNGGIRAEMTATLRAAMHRWSFGPAKNGRVVVDLAHHLSGGETTDASLTLEAGAKALRGRLHHVGGMSDRFGGYDLFFEARFSRAFTSVVWSNGAPPALGAAASGKDVGAALTFDTSDGAPVEMRIGLSFVDAEGAARNLASEIGNRSFDETRARTAADWELLLGRVRIAGGSEDDQRAFYSYLHHAFMMPSVISDADGRYLGMDHQLHSVDGFRYLTDLSLWDTYRTVHSLYALVAPDLARDAVRTLQARADQGGFWVKWPVATGEAGSMIGANAEIVVADAWLRGVHDFDARAAYRSLRAAALDPVAPPGGRGGRDHVEEYQRLGYVPFEVTGGSASRTTEFSREDFALSNLAEELGETDDAAVLRFRMLGWRKLYDPAVGFVRGLGADGSRPLPAFDPFTWLDEYVEANAWHSLWMCDHDLEGQQLLLGGRAGFLAKLTTFFDESKKEWDKAKKDELSAGLPRPYYWHGNEPDIHAPYLFARAGRPDLTQKWVRWIEREFYGARPNGLAGNDDGGTLSSWFVWSALGIYPLPGSDLFVLGAPLFPRARIAVPGGVFTIEAPEVSDENLYVQAVTLDGEPLSGPLLRQRELRPGSTLRFRMGPSPGSWATY